MRTILLQRYLQGFWVSLDIEMNEHGERDGIDDTITKCIDHAPSFCLLFSHSVLLLFTTPFKIFLLSASFLPPASLLSPLCLSPLCLHSGLFCLAYMMALKTSGFSNMALPLVDGRNLTGELPYTPNTSQSQFFNQNSSMLSDCMHNIHMLSDSSPIIHDLIICAAELYDCSFPHRACYPLPWSSGSAMFPPTNYYPVATAHTFNRSL